MKKAKISKVKGHGDFFTVLCAFRSDFMVGVWVVWRGEINNLRSFRCVVIVYVV